MKKLISILIIILMMGGTAAFADEFAKGYVNCDVLNVRSTPDVNSEVVAKIYRGQEVGLLYCNGYNWYCVQLSNGKTGFCSADYISVNYAAPASDSKGEAIIQTAKAYLGKPYVYGAAGPNSFDCSGFTSYVFASHGISLPRTSSSQSGVGTTVARSDLRPGDLVFFATGSSGAVSHVGIYIGDGNIIHAASGQGKVVINNLSQSYYSSRYLWAKRVL